MSKKLSCLHCRRIKRKCDGDNPCSNCQKRNINCEYNQTDKRSQRFSVGYIKSLETNNDVYECTLATLVSLRDDPEKLQAKLDLLASSFPLQLDVAHAPHYERFNVDIKPDENNPHNEEPLIDEGYFGPGSIYHFGNLTKPEKEALVRSLAVPAVSIVDNFDYVKGLVEYFFEHQHPTILSYYLDKETVLADLEKGRTGTMECEELIYAICANCEAVSYDVADGYRNLVSQKLFLSNLQASVGIAQCFMLLAVHDISKGQISNGWLYSGIAIRMGYDLGFDTAKGPESVMQNRLCMGFILLDSYISLAVGRRTAVAQYGIPVSRLPLESNADFFHLKYAVQFVELTRPMLRATYEPVSFDKDPKINYLMKFNRSKAFNVKLLKWKSDLDKECHWLHATLKASKDLEAENHTVKYLYYYFLIFINKPFLHVPKQHSSVYIIEEIAKEMLVIVTARLEKLEGSESPAPTRLSFTQSDTYHWASMDSCMLILLSHVLVTLITEQPDHYLYLEKHFKVFARYMDITSPRKYKAEDNPVERLMSRYYAFKATIKSTATDPEDRSLEMSQLKESIEAVGGSPDLVPLSQSENHTVSGASQCDSFLLQADEHMPDAAFAQQPYFPFAQPAFQGQMPNLSQPRVAQYGMPQVPQYQKPSAQTLQQVQAQLHQFQNYQQQSQMSQDAQNLQFQQHAFHPHYAVYSGEQMPMYPGMNMMPDIATGQYEFGENYSVLPPTDGVGKMMDQLFSNSGEEFDTARNLFNWDALFREQYTKLH